MPNNLSLDQETILEKLKKIFPNNKKLALISEGYCNADSILSMVCKHLGIFDQLVNLKKEIIACLETNYASMAEKLTPLVDFICSIQVEEKKGNRTDFYKIDLQFNRFRFLLDKLFAIPPDFKLAEIFSFACFFNEEDLADLLIKLNTKDTMILLLSEDHTIPIIQEENSSYWFNDPNLKDGPKISDNAQKLVQELKEQFFTDSEFEWEKIPLKLIQFAGPNTQNNNNNNAPNKKQLYDTYLSKIDDINDLTPGFSQLSFAAKHDEVEYMEKLLALGADPNCKDINGETPLINAIRHGSINAIILLTGEDKEIAEKNQQQNLKEGRKQADVNITDSADNSPLIHIIDILNDKDLVALMLQKGASVHHRAGGTGYTGLLTAVKVGNKEIVNLLLNNGAQPNQANNNGETALHMAVRRRNVEMTDYLINESYVDPNRRNLQGETAAHLVFNEDEDTTVPNCAPVELLQAICQAEENKVDIDARDNNGDTALHIACEVGDYDSVEYLLSLGARLNITNNKGELAIDCADNESIKKLIQQAIMQESMGSFSFKNPQSISTFSNANTNNPSSQLEKTVINNLLTEDSLPQPDDRFSYINHQ